MRRPLLAASLTAVAMALSGCAGTAPTAPAGTAPVAFHGKEPADDRRRPSFTLQDTSGRPYDFAAETAGRPTYLYFGYTNCPDECPTAMADVAAALRRTSAALREQVRVVFVTTDPARDSGKVLRRFLDQFSADFVGLRGTQAEVDAAQRAAEVPVASRGGRIETVPGRPDKHVHEPGTAAHQHFGPLGYAVGHPNVILAYDVHDRLPVVYGGDAGPAGIAADLPALAQPALAQPSRPKEST